MFLILTMPRNTVIYYQILHFIIPEMKHLGSLLHFNVQSGILNEYKLVVYLWLVFICTF